MYVCDKYMRVSFVLQKLLMIGVCVECVCLFFRIRMPRTTIVTRNDDDAMKKQHNYEREQL